MNPSMLKVAAIQALPADHLTDPANVPHAVDLLAEAARRGAQLACFHEGYPGSGEEEIRRAARKAGIFAIAGFVIDESGVLFNESVLIDADGRVRGRQRKVHAVPGIEPFSRGSDYPVMETPWGKIGILICIDGWGFPEGFHRLHQAGVDLVFNPCLIFRKKPQKRMSLLSRVLDYKIPIVAPNNAAWSLKVFPRDPGLPAEGGQSLILAPPAFRSRREIEAFMKEAVSCEGWIAAEAGRGEEILTAELDLGALRETRLLWDNCFGACLF